MRAAIAVLTVLALTACANTPEEVLEGPYYTEGFTDGCRTAEARRAAFDTSSYKNDALFEAHPSYAAGFRAGFTECAPGGVENVQPTIAGQQDTQF